MVRAARAALESWAWSDLVVVTDDPGHPALRPRAGGRPGAEAALFVGAPAALAPEVARHVAIVTTAAVAASDLTVLVDRHAATLHPVGRVLRPHLQSAGTEQLLAELVAPPTEVVAPCPVAADGPAAIAPGPVDVRLLTVTPRLDGLVEDLPPNRARRSVELVAYLALHQPDVITSDRLRTASSARPTRTPRPRRCRTPRTRPGAPWAPTPRATRCSRPARATACTSSRRA